MTRTDTIAAISTPPGMGGIGIVRISGPQARQILGRIFRPRGKKPLRSHRLSLGEALCPESQTVLDEVLAVFMEKPNTFTREDVVEFQAHGGTLVLQEILQAVLRCGARLADPGEFTKRAFLNGRIDLTQAEAVIDLIQSKTRRSLELANLQRQGRLGAEIKEIRENLLDHLALLEAGIDFPEDEVPEASPGETGLRLQEAARRLDALLSTFEEGKIHREGVSAVIVGRPNVGKSSLLNALLREDRAIVAPLPGTTRDAIEEGMNLRGIPLRITDTAGLRQAAEEVEREGVRRTRDRMAQADLTLWVVDGSEPLAPEDLAILPEVRQKKAVVAINKTDLPQLLDREDLSRRIPEAPLIPVSALLQSGIGRLEDSLWEVIRNGRVESPAEVLLANVRHKNAVETARDALGRALGSLEAGLSAEFIALDLERSLQALGEIVGETTSEDLLDRIFSRFCIGK